MSTISTTITTGVTLGAGGYASPLTILPAGYVSYAGAAYAVTGTGILVNQGIIAQNGGTDGAVSLSGASSIANSGTIGGSAEYAIVLSGSGGISNSAAGLISGFYGVGVQGAGDSVTNLGTILATADSKDGANLANGGTVTNGAPGGGASTALIQGAGGVFAGGTAAGIIANYGTVVGQQSEGIGLSGGGIVDNGGGGATQALVQGYLDGIVSFGTYSAQISNQATVTGTDNESGSYGILIQGTGTITNSGTAALIQGDGGISIGQDGSVSNTGTIVSLYGGTAGFFGVTIQGDGTVTNIGTAALIEGYDGGIAIGSGGSVTNAGTVLASGAFAALTITGNGTVANTGTASLLQGYHGALIGGFGSVTNAGTIRGVEGYGKNFGVVLSDGGNVINGANGATAALVYGSVGLYVEDAAGTVANYATIQSGGAGGYGWAIDLTDGGSIINGGDSDSGASIYGTSYGIRTTGTTAIVTNFGSIGGGNLGIALNGGGTIIDAGTISGGFDAIYFHEGGDLLALRPGYLINAAIVAEGTGNTLQLQGSVTANYTGLDLTNFQTVAFAPGASATLVTNTNMMATVAGFTGTNDEIDLTNLSDLENGATVSFNPTDSQLTVIADGGSYATLQLDDENYSVVTWMAVQDGDGTEIVPEATGYVPPSISVGNTATFTGGGPAIVLDGSVTVTDVESNGTLNSATISIEGPVSGDSLGFTTIGNITGSYDASTGELTLSGTDTIANYESALDSVSFSLSTSNGDPTDGGGNTSTVIDWSVNDGTASSDTGTTTLDLVHAAPTVVAGATASFTGGGPPVALDPAISITDVDSGGTLVAATVAINGGSVVGDILSYISLTGLGISGSYNASTGTLTLSGTSSIGNYESALASVTYSFTPSGGDPTGGGADASRLIAWSINDGVATSNVAGSVLNDVHIAPSVTASGTVGFSIGGTAAVLDPGIIIADPDSGGVLTSATVDIATGFANGDSLSVTSPGSINVTYNSNTGVLTLSGTASIAAYQSALASITYSSTAPDPSDGANDPTRAITWTVTDGSSSNGVSNVGSTTADVYGPPPSISNTTGTIATYIQQGTPATLDPAITVADTDSLTLTGATVIISGGFLTGDTLTANTTGTAITAVYSNGTLTLSGTDTLADYQHVLESVAYSSSANDPTKGGANLDRTITWQVNDGRGGNNLSNIGTTTIVDHVRPVVTTGSAVTFHVGGGPILVQPTLGVADTDANPILSGTVAISGGFLTGDVLAFNNGSSSQAFGGGVTIDASYNSTDGVLTLTQTGSNDASPQDWQQALASVTFNNPGSNPSNNGADLTRTLTWTLNTADPQQTSARVSSTIDVPQPPEINGLMPYQGVPSGAIATPFANVTITGASPGANDTVTVALADPTAGTLSSSLGGSFNSATGVFSASGTPAQVTAELNALAFTPSGSLSATGWFATAALTLDVTVPGGSVTGAASITETRQVLGLATVGAANVVVSVSSVGGSFSTASVDGDTYEAVVLDPSPGSTDSLPEGYQAEFLGGSSNSTLTDPSSGDALLAGNAGVDTISSGAGGDTLLGAGAGSTMQFTSGASDGVALATAGGVVMLDAGSHDTLLGSSGTTMATLTGANALFFGQAGTTTISAGGHANTVVAGTGGTTLLFTAGASDGVAFAGSAPISMSDAGSHDTLLGSTATTTATLSGSNGLFFTGGSATTVQAGGQSNTIVGGAGDPTLQFTAAASNGVVFGGIGTVILSDAGSNDTLVGSSQISSVTISGANSRFFAVGGTASVSASGHGDNLYGGSSVAAFTFTAGATNGLAFGGSDDVGFSDAGTSDTLVGAANGTKAAISGANSLFFAEGSTDSVSAGGHADTLVGGSGQTTFQLSAAASSDIVFGGSGALGISDAGSHDTMLGGSVSTNATISGANALFFAGGGTASVSAGGQGDTLIGGSSQSTLRFGTSATNGVLFGGSTAVAMSDAGTGDTLCGSSGATSVTLAGTNATFFAETGSVGAADRGRNDSIVAQGNPVAITSSGSGLVVFGGSGSLVFTGGSQGATIMAGSGSALITGGSGGITLFGGAGGAIDYSGSTGGLVYSARSGNETLDASGSTTSNVMFGGSGADSIVGGQGAGQGNDTIAAGSGSDTLAGNANTSSQDLFVFFRANDAGAPHDIVQNFTASDEVLLSGYGASAASAALASATTNGGSVTLTLSDSTMITFANVSSVSNLTGHVLSS